MGTNAGMQESEKKVAYQYAVMVIIKDEKLFNFLTANSLHSSDIRMVFRKFSIRAVSRSRRMLNVYLSRVIY